MASGPAADGHAREWLGVYLKGVFMGTADAIPGVSGGTIALITGIYERLVAAITRLDPSVLGYLPEVHRAEARAALRARLVEMDVPFLLVLGAGIVTAVVSVSRAMHVALDEFRAITFAFFFGLIAASAVVLYAHVAVDTAGRLAAAAVGFTLAFLLTGVTGGGALPHSPAVAFLAGGVAVTAMVLPGVSGAFLLLLLGQYEYLVEALSAFVDGLVGLARGGAADTVLGPGVVVAAFVVGAGVGLLTVAHVIRWALSRYRAATLTFLVSLMVGALRLPAEEVLDSTTAWTPGAVVALLAVAAVGAAVVLALDRYTDDLEYA